MRISCSSTPTWGLYRPPTTRWRHQYIALRMPPRLFAYLMVRDGLRSCVVDIGTRRPDARGRGTFIGDAGEPAVKAAKRSRRWSLGEPKRKP